MPLALGNVASASVAFDPRSITGLVSWYDAADAASFTYSSGVSVSQWNDRSASARHLTQGTVSSQPSRSGTKNGLATVAFNQDFVTHAAGGASWTALHNGTSYAVFFVAKSSGAHTTTGFVGTSYLPGSVTSGCNFYGASASRTLGHRVGNASAGGGIVCANTTTETWTHDTFFVYSVLADPDNATITERSDARFNGGTSAKSNIQTGVVSGASATAGLTFGGREPGDIANVWLVGEIAEVLIYAANITAAQRITIENYLKYKWGIPSFSPTDITGLSAWYDASDASSFSYSSGASVSQWNDKSGTGKHLTQGTVGDQPSRSGTQNGLRSVVFNLDYLVASTAADWKFLHDGTLHTIFYVVKATNSGTNAGFWGTTAGASGQPGAYSYTIVANRDVLHRVSNAVNGGVVQNFTGVNVYGAYDTAMLVSVTADPANATVASRSSILINGGTAVANNVSGTGAVLTSNPNVPLTLGTRAAADIATVGLVGEICELLMYNVTFTLSQRIQVENYLRNKWGLADGLPSVVGYAFDLDAADATQFTFSSGNVVSQWNDKSGTGKHFTQGTVANQPTRSGSLNGKATVVFDGINDYLARAATVLTQPNTTIMVIKHSALVLGYGHLIDAAGATDRQILSGTLSGSSDKWRAYAGSTTLLSAIVGDTSWHVLTGVFNGASSLLRLDGLQVTAGDAGAMAWGSGSSAAELASGSGGQRTPCEFAQIVGYTAALGSADLELIENYLKRKWGLS